VAWKKATATWLPLAQECSNLVSHKKLVPGRQLLYPGRKFHAQLIEQQIRRFLGVPRLIDYIQPGTKLQGQDKNIFHVE
jgi:hypothetical protein